MNLAAPYALQVLPSAAGAKTEIPIFNKAPPELRLSLGL